MTKKDFEFSAGLIKKISKRAEKLIAYSQAVQLFKASNPRFNEAIFRKACGL